MAAVWLYMQLSWLAHDTATCSLRVSGGVESLRGTTYITSCTMLCHAVLCYAVLRYAAMLPSAVVTLSTWWMHTQPQSTCCRYVTATSGKVTASCCYDTSAGI